VNPPSKFRVNIYATASELWTMNKFKMAAVAILNLLLLPILAEQPIYRIQIQLILGVEEREVAVNTWLELSFSL